MKTVAEIYARYKVMPALRAHQFRVAAVAKLLCEALDRQNLLFNKSHRSNLDSRSVIVACLFHDMGNIIKFDLNYFPEFLAPEGLLYWQKVKNRYIEKYGNDEHVATRRICREIGLSERELEHVDAIGFSKIKEVTEGDSIEKKICAYADQRVGPYGILSVEALRADREKRYAGRKDIKLLNSEELQVTTDALKVLESQVLSRCGLQPESITDAAIAEYLSDLKDFRLVAKRLPA